MAALSLSSGFVTEVLDRYQAGVVQVATEFGWEIIPAPNALRGPEFIYEHPQARADDLHWALQNPEIDGLVSIIGGDDSVRLLPYLDLGLIKAHPKPFLGFSDTTVTLLQFLRAGVMAYHGPALLTDLAEASRWRNCTAGFGGSCEKRADRICPWWPTWTSGIPARSSPCRWALRPRWTH